MLVLECGHVETGSSHETCCLNLSQCGLVELITAVLCESALFFLTVASHSDCQVCPLNLSDDKVHIVT